MGHHRRRSVSSSSSSSDEEKKKWKKDKHHKDKHHKHDSKHTPYPVPAHGFPPQPISVGHGSVGFAPPHAFPHAPHAHMSQVHMPFPGGEYGAGHGFAPAPVPVPGRDIHSPAGPPPAYSAPPPSGFRVPLGDNMPFPTQQAGQPVSHDADGRTPVYIGSAIFERAVHPCKIVPAFQPPARVAWGGREHEHRGRYDLLPFDPNTMEWVPASRGQLPPGRRPIEGGYEENGEKLYHALAIVHGVRVPGKTGAHLRGANVPFGGQEHCVEHYEVLVWRH